MTPTRTQSIFAICFTIWTLTVAVICGHALGSNSTSIERGRALFEKRCTGCHSLDNNKEGPHLRGAYGRKAGSVPDFNYSDPLKAANIVWDEPSLDRWLTDPDSLVPDSDMAFHVSSAEERAYIIQFLRLTSGK